MCNHSQVCQALQLLETTRDRAIQSIAIHIAENKINTIKHEKHIIVLLKPVINACLQTYNLFSALQELMFAGIWPSRLLLARFLKNYTTYQKMQRSKWTLICILEYGIGSYNSNNSVSLPSSAGMVPSSSLSFSCLDGSNVELH